MNHRYLGPLLGLLACAPAGMAAQRPGPADCSAAAEAMRRSSDRDHRAQAVERLKACPDDLRVETYLAVLRGDRQLDRGEAMTAAYPVVALRDDRLFQEVVLLAGDKTASVPARVVAFMALRVIRDPSSAPRYEGFTGGVDARGIPYVSCAAIRSHPQDFRDGPVPFSADYLERIEAVSRRVFRDESEPAAVRSAAACT